MSCTGNCNQGRSCTCATKRPLAHVFEVIVILMAVMLVAVCAMLEYIATGSAHWTEFTVVAMAVLAAFGYVIYWLAGRLIAAINFMTRNE